MALQELIFNILQILLILIFLDVAMVSGDRGILSSIYRKAVKDNRPLILVLDNESYGRVVQKSQSNVIGSSSELEGPKSSDKLYQLLKDTLFNFDKSRNKLSKQKSKINNYKKLLRVEDNTPLPPVIRSLLRISNDLQCAAKDECKQECPKEEKPDPCAEKCEEKFECDKEEEKPKDDCPENEFDECEVPVYSTKGALLEPDPSSCPRC